MNEDIVECPAVFADGHSLEQEAVADEAAVHILAEEHLLAVAQMDCAVGADLAVGDGVMDAVVEDDAVLKHLNDRSSVVTCGSLHHLAARFELYVDCAGEEVTAGTEHELGGDKRLDPW